MGSSVCISCSFIAIYSFSYFFSFFWLTYVGNKAQDFSQTSAITARWGTTCLQEYLRWLVHCCCTIYMGTPHTLDDVVYESVADALGRKWQEWIWIKSCLWCLFCTHYSATSSPPPPICEPHHQLSIAWEWYWHDLGRECCNFQTSGQGK